jgi:hypothetical protein
LGFFISGALRRRDMKRNFNLPEEDNDWTFVPWLILYILILLIGITLLVKWWLIPCLGGC